MPHVTLSGGSLVVWATGTRIGQFGEPVARIVVDARGGDDLIVLGPNVYTPAEIYGWAGDDHMLGGGGDGDDHLFHSSTRGLKRERAAGGVHSAPPTAPGARSARREGHRHPTADHHRRRP